MGGREQGAAMKPGLRVIVMTQSDRFFIPNNIQKAAAVCDIMEVVQVDCKASLDHKLKQYLQWFGFFQCAKMGVVTVARALLDKLDSLAGFRLKHGVCSVQSAAKACGLPFRVIHDSNDAEYVAHVRELAPDLIISYSAPQILREELLSTSKHGVINVHGSLLPDFRGCLPSFWYLYCGEKTGGATVHYMSQKIDDGDIIEQDSVDISDCRTMFRLIGKTKRLGGELMVRAIREIEAGTAARRHNDAAAGRYFTWPTAEQAKQFRRRGCRLI